jgi:hypothetical protein
MEMGLGEDGKEVEGSKGEGSLEDLCTELELIERKIGSIDDPNHPDLPELIKQRRKLSRVRRISQLKKQLEAAIEGEDDMGFY